MDAKRVLAPMREDAKQGGQPLECAWTTMVASVANVVPAPMREDAIGSAQPLDSAGTYRVPTL